MKRLLLIYYLLLIRLIFSPAYSQELPERIVTESRADIYKRASRQSGVLRTVQKGTGLILLEVILSRQSDRWFKIEYEGEIGWILDYFIVNGLGYRSKSELEEQTETRKLLAERAKNEKLADYEFAFYSKTTDELNPLKSGTPSAPTKEFTGPIKSVTSFSSDLTNKFGEYVLGEPIFIDSLSFDRHRKITFKKKHVAYNDKRFVEYRFVHNTESKIIEAHISSPYEVHWRGAYQIEGELDSIWTLGAHDERGASLIQIYLQGDWVERKFIDNNGNIDHLVRKQPGGPNRYRTTIYDASGAISQVSIDSVDYRGRIIVQRSYNSNGSMSYSRSTHFKANGNSTVETIIYDHEGTISFKSKSTKDKNGLTLRSATEYTIDKLYTSDEEFEYEFDAFNNWTKKTRVEKTEAFGSISLVPVEVITRSIKYYD